MVTKDGSNVTLDELTADNYVCPKGEETCYHVVLEVKQFDSKTGKRISAPRLQKFGIKMWESLVYSALRKQGYEWRIVHDPRQWIKEYNEKLVEAKAQQAETDKQKREAEKEAMKAEILAELKAAGILAETKKAGRPKKDEE